LILLGEDPIDLGGAQVDRDIATAQLLSLGVVLKTLRRAGVRVLGGSSLNFDLKPDGVQYSGTVYRFDKRSHADTTFTIGDWNIGARH